MYGDIDIMNKALNASWKRNEVLSNNIANAETPNYKRMDVEFKDILKSELGDNPNLVGRRTNEKHIEINEMPNSDFNIASSQGYSTRKDKGNVDIDVEMARLNANSMYYDTVSMMATGKLSRYRTSITGGR